MATLVTGGAGFVGFNLVEALLARGEDVVLFDRSGLPVAAERAVSRHAGRLAVVAGDISDPEQLAQAFTHKAVERIVHCAAVTSGPEREAREPAAIVDVNVRGMVQVLEAARRHGVKRVVHASSGAVYGESLYHLARLHEDSSPVLPLTLYAVTQYAAESVALRLKQLWRLDVVCARLGTVIGPWERATGARDNYGTHTQLAHRAVTGRSAILPRREVRRDWVYAGDVADGLIALLDARASRHHVYNLSSGMDWSGNVLAWCETLRKAYPGFEFRSAAEDETPDITYTDRSRCPMDITRIVQETGFRPRFGPPEAFAAYIDWIKANREFFTAAHS